MKRFLPICLLLATLLPAIGASVKISDLPLSTSPSTNTFIEIADMDAVTKSSKYLLTNKANATPAGITNALGYVPLKSTGTPATGSVPRYSDATGKNVEPTSVYATSTNLSIATATNMARLNVGTPTGDFNAFLQFNSIANAYPWFFTHGNSGTGVDGKTNFNYVVGYNGGVNGQYNTNQIQWSEGLETHWNPDGTPRMEWYRAWVNPGATKGWRPFGITINDDGLNSITSLKAHRITLDAPSGTNDSWVQFNAGSGSGGITLPGVLTVKTNYDNTGQIQMRGGGIVIANSAYNKGANFILSGSDFYIDNNWANITTLYLSNFKNVSISSNIVVGGDVQLTKTITAAGTTGAQTINKTTGRVNFAAAAQTLVVTNSLCTANSIVIATVATDDATALSVKAIPASGQFTLKLNAAATAETAVAWLLTN